MSPCCLHGGLAAVTDSLVGTSALLHAQVVQTSRHPMHPFLPRLQTRSISCLGKRTRRTTLTPVLALYWSLRRGHTCRNGGVYCGKSSVE